jgi:hypothetical protein
MYWMLLPPDANVGRSMVYDDASWLDFWNKELRSGWQKLKLLISPSR